MREGIWRFADAYHPYVADEHRITLGEAATPLVHVEGLLLKRDDLSPGGSHKARSLAYRMSLARQRGEKAAVISSSGNAAVAASLYAAAAGVRLFTFVAPSTNPVKLEALRREGTHVVVTDKPRNLARYAARVFGIPNLTPSLDESAVEGFKSIALEIVQADAVFTFVTSGTSLVGMARVFEGRSALHAVQAGGPAAIAGPSDAPPSRLAGLLGVDETPRASEARDAVAASGGRGWVVSDAEIFEAHEWLRARGIDTSAEGAASVAAARSARLPGRVVVLLTGHGTQWPAASTQGGRSEVASYADVRALLGEYLPEAARA